jgi:aryl-alcohol dehydrogenase-like predicted oxidoreductase
VVVGCGCSSDGASAYLDVRGIAVLSALDKIAASHDVSVAAVALAWLLAKPTVVAPIAARTPEQLAELLPMAELQLLPDELTQLDTAGLKVR